MSEKIETFPTNVERGSALPSRMCEQAHAEGKEDEAQEHEEEEPEGQQAMVVQDDRHRNDRQVVAGRVEVLSHEGDLVAPAGRHAVQEIGCEHGADERQDHGQVAGKSDAWSTRKRIVGSELSRM